MFWVAFAGGFLGTIAAMLSLIAADRISDVVERRQRKRRSF